MHELFSTKRNKGELHERQVVLDEQLSHPIDKFLQSKHILVVSSGYKVIGHCIRQVLL